MSALEPCWRCGQRPSSSGKFCTACGAPIASRSVSSQVPDAAEIEPLDPLAETAPATAAQLASLRAPSPSSPPGSIPPPSPAASVVPGSPAAPVAFAATVALAPRPLAPTLNEEPAPRAPQENIPTLKSGETLNLGSPSPVSPYAVSHVLAASSVPPLPPPARLQVGARVQVEWSNGQRYVGTICELSSGRCLVVFVDGQQHWVDLRQVSAA